MAMKKIQLDITPEGAQVMHGAVQKRAADLANTSTQAGQVEKALLQEADRELSNALAKAGTQDGE